MGHQQQAAGVQNGPADAILKRVGEKRGRRVMRLAHGANYSLNTHKTYRNNNVLVIGASGTGKTRSIVIPNLLETTDSYVISDPKGMLYHRYGKELRKKGYKVRLLDFVHPEKSIGYNPLRYIHSERDITRIANMLVYQGNHYVSKDPFWEMATQLLLEVLIAYLHEHVMPKECNLNSTLLLLEQMEAKSEGHRDEKDTVDYIFKELEDLGAESYALRKYHQLKSIYGAERTHACILMELIARIGHYSAKEVAHMLASDETNIASIGQEKTALFVCVSDYDRSMDSLANLFFTQAMAELCRIADQKEPYRLKVPVRFILDDFATNCRIGDFPRMISSIRSREISVMLMIQALSQLEASYGPEANTIVMNCDTCVYLGGADVQTATVIAERVNATPSHVLEMPQGRCYIMRRGEKARYCWSLIAENRKEAEKKRTIGFAQ